MPFSWTLTWLFMFLLTFTVFISLVLCRAWCRQSHKATRSLLFTIRCCSKHVHLCYFFRPLSVPCSWLGCIIIIINENLLFSHQPIKWQNLPVPSRVTSWDRGPSRAGSQVALGTRLLNPAIYEFTCLFPYLILFLKTNPVNKQIGYPRLCKTNQLTRDSKSKRRYKISNAEFRTCSGFTWKMPGAFLNSVNEWQKIQAKTRTQTRNKNKSKQLNKHKRLDVMLHRSKVLAVDKT